MGVNCVGPLICRFYSINTLQYCECIFSSWYFLYNIFISVAYFIVRTRYRIHRTCTMCVHWFFMLLVRLPVGNRQFVVRFLGDQKLHVDFQLRGGQRLNPCSRVSCISFILFVLVMLLSQGLKHFLPSSLHCFVDVQSSHVLFCHSALFPWLSEVCAWWQTSQCPWGGLLQTDLSQCVCYW